MSGRVVVALAFILILAAPSIRLAAQPGVPPPSDTVRLWTQIHGRVETIRGSQLTLKTDTGQLLRVDISAMGFDERRGLVPGARTSLTGYFGARPNEFAAWFLPMPAPPAAPPAAPEGPPPASQTPPIIAPATPPTPPTR